MKKTICLVTDWYPTKENPYQGLFFKEQAFLVAKEFNYVIVRYREHVKKKPGKRYQVSVINEENNTKEYLVDVNVPIFMYIIDKIHDFNVKHIKKNTIDGIGQYVSEIRKTFTKKTLIDVFDKYIIEKFDVFYCVDAQQEAFNLQCLSEYYNKPYVVGEHAPVPWPGSLIKDINKNAIEKADMFFAISNDKIRQLLLQNIKLPKVVYLGNLIDENKLVIKEKKSNEIKTFIIVAANSYYKNYDMFIDVMERLKATTDKAFKVMIVGYASNKGYSKNIAQLEMKIKNSGFADYAVLIPEVPHNQIGEVLVKADAFVMTSIQEGQPVSAMEAACCGLPIFSTQCGGVEDYVDEKMGRIYAVNDVEGMTQGLKDYLEENIRFDSQYIRNVVVSRFGNKAFNDKFCMAMNEVINVHDRA